MAINAPVYLTRDRKAGAFKTATHVARCTPLTARRRRLLSVQQVRLALSRGDAVLLDGPMPPTKPQPDGYWPQIGVDGLGRKRRVPDALAVIAYDRKRGAYRVVGAHGVGWGQLGRAWIAADDFEHLMAHCVAEEIRA